MLKALARQGLQSMREYANEMLRALTDPQAIDAFMAQLPPEVQEILKNIQQVGESYFPFVVFSSLTIRNGFSNLIGCIVLYHGCLGCIHGYGERRWEDVEPGRHQPSAAGHGGHHAWTRRAAAEPGEGSSLRGWTDNCGKAASFDNIIWFLSGC